jgi:hypothetical protein
MRVEKVKRTSAGDPVVARARHNCRDYGKDKKPAANIDSKLSRFNTIIGAKTIEEVQAKIDELCSKITGKRRKDEVKLLEFMITSSGHKGLSDVDNEAYLKASKTWLEGLYGAQCVVGLYFHRDEAVTHLHAFLVPLETKEIRCKQTKAEREQGIQRTEVKTVLNAHKVTGGFQVLRALQDDFYEKVSSRFGLERGNPVEETKARHRRPSLREGLKELNRQRAEFEQGKKEALGNWELPKPEGLEFAGHYRERIENLIKGAVMTITDKVNDGIQKGIKDKYTEWNEWARANKELAGQNREFAQANKKLVEQIQELNGQIRELNQALQEWQKMTPTQLRERADERQQKIEQTRKNQGREGW